MENAVWFYCDTQESQGKKPAIRNTIKVDFVSLLEINNLETCISF